MARIDSLLEADHKNEALAKRVLDDFTPELLEALEDAAAIFDVLKCFGEGWGVPAHARRSKRNR